MSDSDIVIPNIVISEIVIPDYDIIDIVIPNIVISEIVIPDYDTTDIVIPDIVIPDGDIRYVYSQYM